VRDVGSCGTSPVDRAPPWSGLFAGDPERRLGFAEAVAEYERLLRDFPAAGYAVEIMPKASVAERVARIAARIGSRGREAKGVGR
jgi:predicted ATPase